MKLQDIKVGINYIATKASDDESIIIGDHFIIDEDNAICNITAKGWISSKDVEEACKGMECEPDKEWALNKVIKLKKELDLIINDYQLSIKFN